MFALNRFASRLAVTAAGVIALVAPPERAAAQAQEETLQLYEGLKDHFVLSLPAGWTAINQLELLTKEPAPFGPVIFSSQHIDFIAAPGSRDQGALEKLAHQLGAMERGEVPGIILDRLPAEKGMSCSGFDNRARKYLLRLAGADPMFGRGRQTREEPHADSVSLGGCEGLRIRGKGSARSGEGKILDTLAVSDGRVLFLFSLFNLDQYYDRNVSLFESILSTLRLAAAPPRR
jgi:hypothetical protein